MPIKDCKTEAHIKETAKRIFLVEGKMLATTQDIADAAGVNRTLLHYYFRSRDILINIVSKEALTPLRELIHKAMGSELPFREKLESIVNVFYEHLNAFPYLETFITLQLNQYPDRYEELFLKIPGGKDRVKNFLKEIQKEMDKGTIAPMKPINYFINMFSLLAYPFVARPIYLNMFDLTDAAYTKILPERKEIIMSLLFK